jgi:O-antigen/teichoic acid export membrane protein
MLTFIKRKYHNLVSDQKFSEILTGSAWALSARVIATGIGMITSIIIARCYGAEMMGIVAVLNSFFMLATIFTVLGTNTSILRLIPEHLAKYSPTSAFKVYRKTQYFVAGVSIITGALLFFGSGFIADTIFSKPHLRFYFALAAAFIVFNSLMELNTQAVRGIRLIKVFAFMLLLPGLSTLLILVPITIFFYQKDNPIYAMFASIAITAMVGVWIMERVFKRKTTPDDILYSMPLRKILTISMPMLMSSSMFFIIGQTGIIMLGMFMTEAEVGYYSIAVKLATLTSFVGTAITTIAAPKFSELYHQKNMPELFYVAKKSTKLMCWTSTPILLFLIIFGKYILWALYGQEFKIAYPAIILIGIGHLVSVSSGATNAFMNMTGKQKSFRNIICIAAVINISLNYLLIPHMGITGAALAAMSSLIFWNVTTLLYIQIYFGQTIAYFPLFPLNRHVK